MRDQDKGSLNYEEFSIDEEKKEEELKGSSSIVIAGGDLFLLRDGYEAIASTKRALVPLQEMEGSMKITPFQNIV